MHCLLAFYNSASIGNRVAPMDTVSIILWSRLIFFSGMGLIQYGNLAAPVSYSVLLPLQHFKMIGRPDIKRI